MGQQIWRAHGFNGLLVDEPAARLLKTFGFEENSFGSYFNCNKQYETQYDPSGS